MLPHGRRFAHVALREEFAHSRGEACPMTKDASFNVEVPEEIVERVRGLCVALPEVTVRGDGSRSSARSTAWVFDIRRRPFCVLVARVYSPGKAVPLLVLRADPEERRALLAIGRPFFPTRLGRDRIAVALLRR